MAEIIKKLGDNLKQQLKLFKKIISLEKAKQQALVENKIQELEMVTAREELILLEVGRLEEERLYWAEFFAQETGKQSEKITLQDLEEVYPSFKDIRIELEKVISEMQSLKEINTKLLENAISLVNITINSLASPSKATYSKNKIEKKMNNEIFFIDKDV
ncbi:MAG: flagellar protein FlgN [Peptococcaceae bacterium]|nr:flagellar protein FlgN [Peptococcaceae bacterium]